VDSQIDKIESEIHEHLEIEHGDVTTYVNVFDAHPDLIEVVIGKTDNSGKLQFNKHQMFFTEDQFSIFASFISNVNSKIYLRDRTGRMEKWRTELAEAVDKQVDFVHVDNDHVDLSRVNLARDIQDSVMVKTKMRASKDYCKRFYATLCNNELHKKNDVTGYSWRATGGLIADILCFGDYMDWYCSGNEGWIDVEVQQDLLDMGWEVKHYPVEDEKVDSEKLF
jgi:hypothetical protein